MINNVLHIILQMILIYRIFVICQSMADGKNEFSFLPKNNDKKSVDISISMSKKLGSRHM